MNFDIDYRIKKNFIDSDEISSLNKRFDDIKSKKTYASIHKNIIELSAEETSMEPVFNNTNKIIRKYFVESLGLKNLQLTKLWLVTTTHSDVNQSQLPYVPHFDKLRYFKAMVYLHAITTNHGPIYLGKIKNEIDIEKRRKNLPDDYKTRGLNVINEQDLKEGLTPMVGDAGDVIFFDTNIPHKAGVLTEGHERRVLRFDFELPGLNPKSTLLRRIINKYF